MPFTPTARRYSGYKKFYPRVDAGLALFKGQLKTAIDESDWEAVNTLTARASKGTSGSPVSDLPLVLGLMANTLVQSENEGTTNANYLCHSYANEVSHAVDEMGAASAAKDKAATLRAWRVGREYIDAYLSFVNPVITDKVGEKFGLLFSDRPAAKPPAPMEAAGTTATDPDACRVAGRYLECLAARSAAGDN